jgi:hypothetical protein
MDGMKATEQHQDSKHQDSKHQDSRHQDSKHQDSKRQRTDLDNRYRKIGISAVAAAVRHQGEPHNTAASRAVPYDRD